MASLVSDQYRDQLRMLHAGRVWGDEGHLWAGRVTRFGRRLGALTVLDYGCGSGTLAPAIAGRFEVREYDPGVPGKDALPAPADLLVATDVMEHIEPEALDAVLAHMAALAGKGVFLAVATGPASARLPDGRNAHLIVEPAAWWLAKLLETWPNGLSEPYARGITFRATKSRQI